MTTEAATVLVFAPLVAAMVMIAAPRRAAAPIAVLTLAALPLALIPLVRAVVQGELVPIALAGHAAPLGIVWRADALAVTMLLLTVTVLLPVSLHALASFPPSSDDGRRFWPLWLIMAASIAALFLSADLFNLYVTLELVTLAGVALIAVRGEPAAMRAAMRYLLLGLMASLFYLLATALLYGQTGTLDLYLIGERLEAGGLTVIAVALMVTGLLVKAAIVPLHVWLPAAHGKAPGPVSAVLSALVVKVALYILIRLWYWGGGGQHGEGAAMLLGVLGALAILYGSMAAITQRRLKMLVAYSTLAQLGYVMLLFPLASAAAFRAVTFHVVAHGIAKAAMFLAAANLLHGLGSDRLQRLAGASQRHGLDVLAFALAGVSIMGLPPSGGFVAKWLLLQAAWHEAGWLWVAVISVGSLLAAAYVFRVVALTVAQPPREAGPVRAAGAPTAAGAPPAPSAPPGRPAGGGSAPTSVAGLLLAVLAIVLGLVSAPLVAFIDRGVPPGMLP
jgi:multicomponent Na+:H+ antiporter subunit D